MFRQDCPKRVGFTILFPHNTVAFKHGFSHMNLPRAKRLKSDGHPVHPESARAAVLASLADVDRVVIFLENTPVKLIDAIRPEVLVKGADYTRHTVVAGDIVERYGGRVLLADLIPGYSTTATI